MKRRLAPSCNLDADQRVFPPTDQLEAAETWSKLEPPHDHDGHGSELPQCGRVEA